VAAALIAGQGRAEAQLGALLSPGALTKAHSGLEGIANCQKCHEQGRRITAEKCLACHKPVADRIARKVGVHQNVKGDCVTCHVEHNGTDGELRPFDPRGFDHAGITKFALDGKHAAVAANCAACHKTRSFLTVGATCQSCHADVHKGRLGANCASCHTTRVAFKDVVAGGRFDHSKAAFPLVGAHTSVACASCHVNSVFKGLAFSSCTSCHKDPHNATNGPTCTACHTNTTWRTTKIDHSRTAFPLVGRHTTVACRLCHKQDALKVKPKADTCAACHVDVHRGTFKQDCKACHSENGFEKAPFDHTKTRFSLLGKHGGLQCAACHKGVVASARTAASRVADFRGLATTCVSCHADVHRAELGSSCESCHTATSFTVATYKHARFPEFFGGQHASITCVQCHRPTSGAAPPAVRAAAVPARDASVVASRPAVLNVAFKATSTSCVACHKDVHLGQVGTECQKCHTIESAKFAAAGFSHATTAFPLTGKHQAAACSVCHKPATGAFPAGTGTAVLLKGVQAECRACHQDVHLGQVENRCDSCHTTQSFSISNYKHRNTRLTGFFVGRHVTACQACHKPATTTFPAGHGTAIAFALESRCTACHRDIHNGSLPDCQRCHRP
jgi:hypothetical protein